LFLHLKGDGELSGPAFQDKQTVLDLRSPPGLTGDLTLAR